MTKVDPVSDPSLWRTVVKKPLKISLIVVGFVAVMLGGFVAWVLYQFRDMQVGKTARITDSLYVIDCGIANAYVLTTGNQALVFDTGTDTEALAEGFAALGLAPDMVSAVFLTHSDGDHTGGLPLFTKAKVYLSRNEVAHLDGRSPRHFLFVARKNTLPVSEYLTMEDGDTLTFGAATVRAILTAGHTAGSMSFLVDTMLFTGDLCLVKDGVVEPMVPFVTENRAADIESIRAIARLSGIKYLCTAHTGICDTAETALAKWR
jgi:hydroxyacylglutathione hydrolase